MRGVWAAAGLVVLGGWGGACGGGDSSGDVVEDADDTGDADIPPEDDAGEETDAEHDADAADVPEDGPPVDEDGDTYPAGEDCDDGNAAVHPGAEELCNGVDDDCDGVPDGSEGLARPCGVSDVGVCTLGTETCDDAGAWVCDAVLPADADLPDPAFLDENCDGVDGDLAAAVFVSAATGDDAGDTCAIDAPCRTIGRGLAVAAAGGRTQVLVQTGSYAEIIDLSAAHDGLGIYGGYDAEWARGDSLDPASATVVTGGYHAADGGQYLTVRARGVGASFQLLVLRGPDAAGTLGGGQGRSSHVVHALDARLAFSRVAFLQGNGAPGLAGGDATTPGAAGTPGNPGEYGVYWLSCDGARPQGGAVACGDEDHGGRGGDGGAWSCRSWLYEEMRFGTDGAPGSWWVEIGGGVWTWMQCSTGGTNGWPGNPGSAGAEGSDGGG
ncbi:MAG: putative metal-binding motif-containing protein, partial [Deltaproteobacteria bacterium]|nr:putative metal-binding motif-containing protein [Deltaproteobacteria bacterium]